MEKPRIIVASSDSETKGKLNTLLGKFYEVEECGYSGLLDKLQDDDIDCVLLDAVPAWRDSESLLIQIHSHKPMLPVILLTNGEATRKPLSALMLGAWDYISKPLNPDEVLFTIEKTLSIYLLQAELHFLKHQVVEKILRPKSLEIIEKHLS